MTAATAVRPATHAQMDTIRGLLAQLKELDAPAAEKLRVEMNQVREEGLFGLPTASSYISSMIDYVKVLKAAAPKAPAVKAAVPTGNYAVATDAGHLAFYRVWVGDYATKVYLMVSDDDRALSREMGKTILRKIEAAGVLECSKAYGREIGRCGVCSRTLTNPDSIALGIGPICAGRIG